MDISFVLLAISHSGVAISKLSRISQVLGSRPSAWPHYTRVGLQSITRVEIPHLAIHVAAVRLFKERRSVKRYINIDSMSISLLS